jgi:hypothetical protein
VASIPWSRAEQITKFLKQKGADVWIAWKLGVRIHARDKAAWIDGNALISGSSYEPFPEGGRGSRHD